MAGAGLSLAMAVWLALCVTLWLSGVDGTAPPGVNYPAIAQADFTMNGIKGFVEFHQDFFYLLLDLTLVALIWLLMFRKADILIDRSVHKLTCSPFAGKYMFWDVFSTQTKRFC